MADLPPITIGPNEGTGTVLTPSGPQFKPGIETLPGQGEGEGGGGGGTITPTPIPTPTPAPQPPTAPEGEPDTTALPELSKLALLLLVLAFIAVAKAFTDFLNWLFRSMLGPLWPRTGRRQLDSKVVTQSLSNSLGNFAKGVDSELGVSFTRMAETAGLVGTFIFAVAELVHQLARKIARLEGATAGVQAGQSAIRQSQRAQKAQQKAAQAQLAQQQASTAASTHSLQQQVDHLTHHITHVLEPELDGLRHAIPQLQKGAADTLDELKQHSEALGLAAMTATVATAMGRLGASWTRCEANQLVGKELCNTGPDKLRHLFEGLFDIAAILDLCSLVTLLVDVAESDPVQLAIGTLASSTEALIQCRNLKLKKPLRAGKPSLSPTLTPYAALAPVG